MKRQVINYSDVELAFIKSNCTLTRRELTEQFNKQFHRSLAVSNIASLCKRNGWLTGRTGRYEIGNIPHPNAKPKGPNKTSFKKGSRPHNWKPVGSERVNVDGYIEIKTEEPKTWELKHRVVWEEENGPIQPGTNIRFIDNNRLNVDPSNLEEIPDAENLYLNQNGYAELQISLKPTMKAVAKLDVAAFRLRA